MRWAFLAVFLAGCLDYSVPSGSLRCDPGVDPPCPDDWLCLLEATADRYGRCYAPDASLTSDPRVVGPRAAPSVTVPGQRYYVDPLSGAADNDGSEQAPWRTLAEVVTTGKIEKRAADNTLVAAGVVRAGDALVLRDGDHGKVDLSGYFNPQMVYVLADDGARPRLGGLTLRTGRNFRFQGLTIQASGCAWGEGIVAVGDRTAGDASKIELVGNTLQSTEDATGWSKEDWKSRACAGVWIDKATEVRAAFNEVRYVSDGVRIHESIQITVERNLIDGFREKAVPITGRTRGLKILGNLVTNAYGTGSSQTFIHGSGCAGCGIFVIRGNRMLAHRGDWVPATARKPTQGIGLFNGPFERIEIVNNLVIGNHWNGIAVLEATDVKVINNTTVLADVPTKSPDSLIRVTGSLSTVIVRNNLANGYEVAVGATKDHNGLVSDPAAYFVDWAKGDYRPSEGGPAVDSGSADGAPPDDMFGRPRDDRPDLGAIER
jgi:hypothetical protein